MSRWAAQTSWVRVSARSRPSPPRFPHFNRPSGFWPCVKSCLVGGSDKYSALFDSGTDLAECWLVDSLFPPASGGHPLMEVDFKPESPLIRGMPTRLKVFLVMLDACGLWPYDRTHLKNGLVPYFSGGGTDDKYRVLPSLTLWQSDWRSTPFYLCCIILLLIYLYLSSCLSSGPFTGPQHIHNKKRWKIVESRIFSNHNTIKDQDFSIYLLI